MDLVDSDVLVEVFKGRPEAVAWLAGQPEAPKIVGFVAMELVQGCANKPALQSLHRELAKFDVVWPSEIDCALALAEFRRLWLSDGIGIIDCLIAATAVGDDATLYTFNLKHFRKFQSLTVASPYTRVR